VVHWGVSGGRVVGFTPFVLIIIMKRHSGMWRSRCCEDLPAGHSPSVWLRWPYLVACERADVRIYHCTERDDALHLHSTLSLSRYRGAELASGRGAHVLQCVDVRCGWLVGGTSSGMVLALALDAAASAAAPLECAGHTKVVSATVLSPDGQTIYSASLDRTARVWSLPAGSCVRTVKLGTPLFQLALVVPTTGSGGAAAGAGAQQLLIGCGDGTVRLWEPACAKASRAAAMLCFL
jgi:hypothetical protein